MKAALARKFHLSLALIWLANIIAVPFFVNGWKMYLLEISLYANFVGHWSGYSAERPTEIEER